MKEGSILSPLISRAISSLNDTALLRDLDCDLVA